jgi:Xaa-Pro aminopeptidase
MGADGLSFTPIVAMGENSAIPHHLTGDRKLKYGDILLIDFGVKVQGYCGDMTETFVFGESTNPEYEKVIEIVKQAMELGKSEIPKDSDMRNVDRKVRVFIDSQGYESYVHSLGHGVGLEIHESPVLNENAKENFESKKGMVVTVEPGIYIPGKFGVRIEEMMFI